MKYELYESVRVRRNLKDVMDARHHINSETGLRIYISSHMLDEVGKVFRISSVDEAEGVYRLREDKTGWYWPAAALEPVGNDHGHDRITPLF